jgi:hypothetical protein
MNNIAIYLDVDGVLNQYDVHERLRRHKIHKRNKFSKETDTFNPFGKKVLRLYNLIKKYQIDVYVFSAWRLEDLQPHLPFKLMGDTRKWANQVNEISKNYTFNLLIDDEVSSFINRPENTQWELGRYKLNKNILTYQPNYNFGLVKKDFKTLKRILNEFRNN